MNPPHFNGGNTSNSLRQRKNSSNNNNNPNHSSSTVSQQQQQQQHGTVAISSNAHPQQQLQQQQSSLSNVVSGAQYYDANDDDYHHCLPDEELDLALAWSLHQQEEEEKYVATVVMQQQQQQQDEANRYSNSAHSTIYTNSDMDLALALSLQHDDAIEISDDDEHDDHNDYYHGKSTSAVSTRQGAATAPDYYILDQLHRQQQQQEENDLLDEKQRQVQIALDEEQVIRILQQQESQNMKSTTTGKAWQFVERVLELVHRMEHSIEDDTVHKNKRKSSATVVVPSPTAAAAAGPATQDTTEKESLVRPVATDDMVFATERLLLAQDEFRAALKPFHVQLGYHYTNSKNLGSIRTDGLMTKLERSENKVSVAKENGSRFGDGVYTATNPSSFHKENIRIDYGDVGLLVVRLLGANLDCLGPVRHFSTSTESDSITVSRDTVNEFIVLSGSRQCIPIFQFPARSIRPFCPHNPDNVTVFQYHKELQAIVDDIFNDGVATVISPYVNPPDQNYTAPSAPLPTTVTFVLDSKDGTGSPMSAVVANAKQLKRSNSSPFHETIQYIAPTTTLSNACLWYPYQSEVMIEGVDNQECPVCFDPLIVHEKSHDNGDALVRLLGCHHIFHEDCLLQFVGQSLICSVCQRPMKQPQGDMPTGIMTSRREPETTCSGYEPAGSIVIEYIFHGCSQLPYHPHPGVDHDTLARTAYLPDTAEGDALLKRLKYAFLRGLTFTVGFSQSQRRDDCVTWASIPHKTSVSGGVKRFGYPDPHYFRTCNMELDALFVPQSSAL